MLHIVVHYTNSNITLCIQFRCVLVLRKVVLQSSITDLTVRSGSACERNIKSKLVVIYYRSGQLRYRNVFNISQRSEHGSQMADISNKLGILIMDRGKMIIDYLIYLRPAIHYTLYNDGYRYCIAVISLLYKTISTISKLHHYYKSHCDINIINDFSLQK